MKSILNDKIKLACLAIAAVFILSSCSETHYYHRYHHHTHDWYDRHHEAPPAGVDFNVDVR
ncbi:MAG: hypothetical protein WDM71_10595 [Ferruginibacter sp.]